MTATVALVTGASRGIGRAIAMELTRQGMTVIGTATSESGASSISEAIKAAGGAGWGAALDVRNAAGVDALIADIETKTGSAITVLVNNAGITRDTLAMRMKDEDWDDVLDTNLKSVFRMCRAVMRGMMKARTGRIVNITSAMVKTPMSPMGLSTGARTGLTSVAKALSKDVAHANVTINNLLPERFDTERQQQMANIHAKMANISVEEAYAHMAKSIAAGRLGRPEEFGDACAFLCSAQAGYISGQNLQLDGGSFAGLM